MACSIELEGIVKNQNISINNQVTYLKNHELQDAKIELANNAKEYFWGAVFLLRCDEVTMPFYELLLKKQKEGVDVRLITDFTGNIIDPQKCYKKLKKMGLNIQLFKKYLLGIPKELRGFGKEKSTVFHPKFWIADGKVSIVDGVNLLNIHMQTTDDNFMYSDHGLRSKGPVVTDLSLKFIEYWNLFFKESPKLKWLHTKLKNQLISEKEMGFRPKISEISGRDFCFISDQNPAVKNVEVSNILIKLIENAQHNLKMMAIEYLFGDGQNNLYHQFVKSFLVKAKELNIDFFANQYGTWSYQESQNNNEIDHGDSFIGKFLRKKSIKLLNELAIPRLKEVKQVIESENSSFDFNVFFTHQFNHGKMLMVDDQIVAIGSHNMNDRSFLSDIELMQFCTNKDLIDSVNTRLEFLKSKATLF